MFCCFTKWPPDNPTLYFVTAAHVVLGGEATNDTGIGRVSKILVKYSTNGFWDVNTTTVRVPQRWETYYQDFALFTVSQAGRHIKTVPLSLRAPAPNGHFAAVGFPRGLDVATPISGTIQVEPGNGIDEPWFVADANLSPGTSGGPVFTGDGVFAIVQGRHREAEAPKFLVPLAMTTRFLQDYIPNFSPYSAKKIVQREVSTSYFEVKCLETKSDTIAVEVPLEVGEELLSVNATLEQLNNLRVHEARVISAHGTKVAVRYTFLGPKLGLFGCKGDGHATLKVVATIRQSAGG